MNQAIITKYLSATNSRGARIKATCAGSSITLPWDYKLDATPNHKACALALCAKLGWSINHASLISGSLNESIVWVHR